MTTIKNIAKPNSWIEPKELTDALGAFDTAPFSLANRPWDIATTHYSLDDQPLMMDWSTFERTWLYPPQGNPAKPYLEKMVAHGNGIALLPSRTETHVFTDYVWQGADAVLFIKSRLTFHHTDGTKASGQSGWGSALVAYGDDNVETLRNCDIQGCFIDLRVSNHQLILAA